MYVYASYTECCITKYLKKCSIGWSTHTFCIGKFMRVTTFNETLKLMHNSQLMNGEGRQSHETFKLFSNCLSFIFTGIDTRQH